MGRKGTVNIDTAVLDPRKATSREELALERMETNKACVQDFIAVENLYVRCQNETTNAK
ncbi:hypothetical protein [Adlercreutzia sp. ZJ138]|uniref:hypothetical protein n=1 Tax=Adlercreutzia sp. ZJ138 TaxID=2709405 RepID=UPI0013ED1047|nr:hypothetical protein [Adlercreutzia sp. ZJ138]